MRFAAPLFLLTAALTFSGSLAAAETPVSPEAPAAAASPQIEFDRIEDGAVHFKAPEGSGAAARVKLEIHDAKYLGALQPTEGGIPYFLFAGKPCANCAEESSIFMIQPSNRTKPSPVMNFVHPGRILDSKDRSLLLESRAFFGKCLSRSPGDVYVVFQKERVDRRRGLQSSVFVAEPGKDRVSEKLIEKRLPSIRDTLNRVKRKECREVDGRYRLNVKRPLDLRYRSRMKDDANKDEEEDEKDEKDEKASPELDPNGPAAVPVPEA